MFTAGIKNDHLKLDGPNSQADSKIHDKDDDDPMNSGNWYCLIKSQWTCVNRFLFGVYANMLVVNA